MFCLLHTENNVLFVNKVRARSPGLGWKLFNDPVKEALHEMCPHLNLIKTKRTRICSCTQGSSKGELEQTTISGALLSLNLRLQGGYLGLGSASE